MDINKSGQLNCSRAAPTISIVIPICNEARVLPQALCMLRCLEGVEEVVFVDGGSSDGSRAMIREAGFVCLESEAGRAKQMNIGASHAIYDIILFLHVDTSLTSSNISSISKAYTAKFPSGRFDVELSNNNISYCLISFFINIRSRISRISTGDQAMFVRRDIFIKIGGFPDIPLMEDVAISRRLRKVGKVACLRDKVTTSSRRWEQNGVFKTVYLMWKLRFLYWIGVSPDKLATMYKEAR